MKKSMVILCGMLLVFGVVGMANATLYDRGGGLIYDDVLKITWLQDAYYAGHIASYTQAVAWAENLTYYDSVRNVTWSDWRLPHTLPVDGVTYNGNGSYSFNGSTDDGYNISAPGSAYPESLASEMAYMYYDNLGNKGAYNLSGVLQSGYGPVHTGPFINLESRDYWSGSANPAGGAWYFYFGYGLQVGDGAATTSPTAWAVRDGDVAAPVPEPATMLLLASGLAGLAALRRKFKDK